MHWNLLMAAAVSSVFAGDIERRSPEAGQRAHAFVEWANAEGRAIRSTTSDDYSDLEFLRDAIGDTRVVMLGESAHGVREYNEIKGRLVRFLHERMGFRVLAFESPMFECALANRVKHQADPSVLMRMCMWTVWNTHENIDLMTYVKGRGNGILVAAFDTQPLIYGADARPIFFNSLIHPDHLDYRKRIADLERKFWAVGSADRLFVLPTIGPGLATEYARLADYLERRARTQQLHEQRRLMLFGSQLAHSTRRYLTGYALEDSVARSEARDEGMAENLRFIVEQLYPDEKVIVWGHNSHIARANEKIKPTDGQPSPKGMGGYFASYGIPTYTVGLFARRGRLAMNNRQTIDVIPPTATSVEYVAPPAGTAAVWYDLAGSSSTTAAPRIGTDAKSWGVNVISMVPAEQFDAILVVDEVHPPNYWWETLIPPATVPLP